MKSPEEPVQESVESPSPQTPTGVSQAGAGGKNGPFPEGLKGWNWGAFLLSGFWAIGNQVWIGLLSFVPYIGIIMPFILGAKGNERAWNSRKFESVDHFRAVQRAWTRWGVGLIVASIIITVLTMVAMILLVNNPRGSQSDYLLDSLPPENTSRQYPIEESPAAEATLNTTEELASPVAE